MKLESCAEQNEEKKPEKSFITAALYVNVSLCAYVCETELSQCEADASRCEAMSRQQEPRAPIFSYLSFPHIRNLSHFGSLLIRRCSPHPSSCHNMFIYAEVPSLQSNEKSLGKSDLPSKLLGTQDQLPACVFYDVDNQ